MKKTICYLFILLSCCLSGFGQAVDTAAVVREVDSLIQSSIVFTDKRDMVNAENCQMLAEKLVLEKLGEVSGAYGRICYNQGRICFFKASYPEAETWYIKSLNVREKALGKKHADYAKSLDGLGILYYYTGKYDLADSLYLESRSIYEKTLGKESLPYALSLNNSANLYMTRGMYEPAERLFSESRGILEKVTGKDHFHYAMCLLNTGMIYYHWGQYEKAIELYTEAAAIYGKTLGKQSHYYAWAVNSLANTYRDMCRYEAAEKLFLEAKAIREKTLGKQHPQYLATQDDLAKLYYDLGDYETAETLYLDTKKIREETGRQREPEYTSSLSGLATLYMRMGNYEKAQVLLIQNNALAAQKSKESVEYSNGLTNLATVYAELSQYDKCVPLYLEALAITEKSFGVAHTSFAAQKINLANFYYRLGNFEEAEKLYREATDIFENNLNLRQNHYYLDGLKGLVLTYANTGRYTQAQALCTEIENLSEKVLGKEHPKYNEHLFNCVDVYWKAGQPQIAEKYIREANRIQNYLLEKALRHLSERELVFYIRKFEYKLDKIFSFGQLVQTTSPGFTDQCFDNILFYKGLLLNTSGNIKQTYAETSPSAEKIDLLKSYNRLLSIEYSKPISDKDSVKIARLEEQANTLEKELVRTVAGFGDATRQVNWQDVRSALHPGEAAIEFIHFNCCTPDPTDSVLYAALLLKPGMPHPKFIPLCSEKDLLALLPASGGLNIDQVNALYGDNDLYRLIWAPLEQELQGIRLAYCSPSGLLHRLNLGALPAGAKQTVSDRFQVITLGSTRQLVLDPGAGRAPTAASAIVYGGIRFDADSTALEPPPAADPGAAAQPRGALAFSLIDSTLRGGYSWPYLKWSDKEADNIRAVLAEAGIAAEVRKGAAATEESFKQIGQSGPSPRILHVSTHGYFFPDPAFNPQSEISNPQSGDEPVFKLSEHPMIRSGLILAGANQAWSTGAPLVHREDGVLTAYEISQLDLRHTELVVLSACETGLGDIRGNEGVYGLQRAFKIAGARNVMMSLWQVPDYQTQELMTVFYRKMLVEQLPVRQALRAAQEAMRAKRYEPYYWAGFVIVE